MGGRTTEQDKRLHILTVNVNGLEKNGEELLKELEKLKDEKREVDVVLLTETHKKDRDAWKIYEKDWKIYPADGDSQSKGAAILLNKKRNFRFIESNIDCRGHYVTVSCYVSRSTCTFVSLCHPDESGLVSELSEKIKPQYADILVVGGNFNTALEKEKDRTSTSDNGDQNIIQDELGLVLKKHNLIDAWKLKNPGEEQRTYMEETDEVSRLHVFINADKQKLVRDCRISDHHSVSLILVLKDQISSSTVRELPKDPSKCTVSVRIPSTDEDEDEDCVKKMKEKRKDKKCEYSLQFHQVPTALTGEMASRTTEQDRRLHILTVNVNGLKTNGNKLLIELQRLESANRAVDVVLLTETHIGENKTDRDALKKFEEDWTIFFTCYHFKSKGAAILVNKKRGFRCLPEIVDDLGRYVIVSCWISGTLCTFVSVYHHKEEKGLFKELSKKIKLLHTDILVIGGDFNTALHEVKDRTSPFNNPVHNRIRKELLPFMGKHDLIDAWREKNPNERKYTYVKGLLEISRLDYFFINADKWELVQDCRINRDKISDHRSVSLILDLNDQTQELKILSCTVHDLPRDEDLEELGPDIILLTKGKAKHEDYIQKMKEVVRKKIWNVLWSDDSNAAILVAEEQREMHILFTVHKEDYVILHCIALGRHHTFVSVYHPTKENLQNMLGEIMPSYSGRKVIGGDFNTSDQIIMQLMNRNEFNIPEGGAPQSRYLIHAQVGRAYEIKEEEISGRLYSSLILHLPEMNPKDVDNIIRSLGQLKIHH